MEKFRAVMERLARGSSVLGWGMARGVATWLKAGEKVSDFVVRVLFLGFPVGIVWTFLAASRSFMWLFAIVWFIAAWRAGRPAQGEQGKDAPDLHPDDLVELLWELTGDRKGVHLSAVAAQLQKEIPGRQWSVPEVKALLKAAGVPTRHSVRVPGVGVAVGVHRKDIPGSPSPAPSGTPGSGVDPQVNAATATATTYRKEDIGGGAAVVLHPEDGPSRHTVVQPPKN
ncbi:hypothetical protein ACFYXS_02770 [Streptomyces sp. NPDC002574]|uniref:hypothetical protein n=1 Tax=Streptomyces sp. NPDC002574 TaxID=3364652 RepID=UPI0036D1AF4F